MTNPNEKEWYRDEKYNLGGEDFQRDIPAIVAEAERRGQVKGLNEAMKIVADFTPFHITREYRDTDAMRDNILNALNTKLTELKKV